MNIKLFIKVFWEALACFPVFVQIVKTIHEENEKQKKIALENQEVAAKEIKVKEKLNGLKENLEKHEHKKIEEITEADNQSHTDLWRD